PVFELYKKEEDKKFVKDLFRKSILKETDYRNLIDKYTINWEIDRIAFMDILVMQLAISEMIGFPEIPVKVSLNEYLEIAKFYCTERSSSFINGILDKIVHDLRRDKVIIKRGKGLIGEDSFN
ncbi:MAG: transcription antitermination factor NusB, partial [Bacteroidales bacterium]|nr:transcription antitermination factor NusB [Bacteroidales bacterium]